MIGMVQPTTRRRKVRLNPDGTPKTTRRDEIIQYMATFITDHHNAPSTYEIGQAMGMAQQTVYSHMVKLMAEGRLLMIDGKWKLPAGRYEAPEEP